MLKPVRLAAILAAALVAGCFEGKAEFDLNPDGSGKVVADFLFPSRAPWLLKKAAPHPADPSAAAAEPAANPEEDMNDCVGAFIKKSTGIDAWKDVSFQRAADGRIQFKGTAYFKDLTKVKVFPDDRAGRISFGPDGTTALTLILNRAKPVTEPPKPAKPMTPEEITKRIKDFRDKFQVAKGAVTTDMPGMKLDLVFNAPGTLEESRGLVQQGLTLSYALEGNKVVMAMDAEMTDGAMLRQWAMAGKAPTVKDIMNEKLFGVKGEVWARWKGPFRPRFDYAAEMDAAKKAQPQMMVKLGLEKPRTPPPASTPAKATPAPKKGAAPAPAKKAPDAPAGKELPTVPVPDPTKIPAPIL